MKNIKYIIASLIITVSSTSCSNDFLEEKPRVDVELKEGITNEKNLAVAILGLHNALQNTDSYGALIPTLNELLADNSFVSLRNSNRFAGTRQTDLSYYVTQQGNFASLWGNLYNIIANANFVLSYEGKIQDDTNTSETPVSLFAQAHAVRAMAYYDLITHFSEVSGNGNQDLGVPLPLVLDVNAKLPRSTVAQIYNQILSDLTTAEGKILNTNKRQINNSAVDMLFSRYYLAVKNYSQADVYSQKILNSNFSSLSTATEAPTMFSATEEGGKETIFKLEFNDKDLPGANDGITATWYSGGRYRQNFATRAFYDKLSNSDVRKNSWFTLTSVGSPAISAFPDNPKPVDVAKYKTPATDIILMRKSEAVFNQLEALYYTNPTSALAKLNTHVSTYRVPGYVFAGTGQALLEEILFQKNAELFLEGFRYRDLKRNGIGFTNSQTGVTLNSTKYQFKAFPIPQGEMLSNPNIKQFPGY
ncbi:RagB/SusD family nutrient uptake outer membrane protein [Chryseobacterium sp. L7]|uniref:RagB/SusD family nutrient uptake outer membrane protein n=1 Tax=Chryseobacterium endalhagicum TaxID=2797638 RepID=A0ABS1QBP1_9FLAO|nr:RagB/SusD family nutrient uptake outer membrane protein [Chryseobacterium endalhagicum]MBL1220023.1 RagB/SusD family nutrient uptake outer membrane protein [Chryseobacterium endalhagicum]